MKNDKIIIILNLINSIQEIIPKTLKIYHILKELVIKKIVNLFNILILKLSMIFNLENGKLLE